MPTLADGEFYFAVDEYQLYVGLKGDSLPIGNTMAVQIQDGSTLQKLAVWGDGSVITNSGWQKTLVMQTGTLTTTSTTAGQIILTYTAVANKYTYIEYLDLQARLTTLSATAQILGLVTVLIGGVNVYTATFVNPTTSSIGSQAVRLSFSEPLPITAGTSIVIQVTPASATSMFWIANFGGFNR
jgi:hypothetical protein